MTCSICNHPKRAEIEKACLLRNFGDTEVTLKDIAKEFGIDHRDLQVHVLMHQALEDQNESDAEKVTSIADKIKMREADILHQVMEESLTTFKNLSAKINRIVSVHTIENPTMQQITKSMTDLYLGTSQSIRDTADKLCKMNLMLNGEDDKGLQQVAALVEAIHGN